MIALQLELQLAIALQLVSAPQLEPQLVTALQLEPRLVAACQARMPRHKAQQNLLACGHAQPPQHVNHCAPLCEIKTAT